MCVSFQLIYYSQGGMTFATQISPLLNFFLTVSFGCTVMEGTVLDAQLVLDAFINPGLAC